MVRLPPLAALKRAIHNAMTQQQVTQTARAGRLNACDEIEIRCRPPQPVSRLRFRTSSDRFPR